MFPTPWTPAGTSGETTARYVVRIGNQILYDFGDAPAWFLEIFKAFLHLRLGDPGPGAGHLDLRRAHAAAVDGIHRQHGDTVYPTKGNGDHAAVNGMVATEGLAV